ncbi:MAG TPA: nodulation protein NfeD [Azospirillum sp.]|nr:nodulation protein NfeD [Azospirillum sp.]
MLALLLLAALGLGLVTTPRAAPPVRTGLVLDVDGAIGPASAAYLASGLAKAAARGAPLVVLRMDTPGGLDTSMREIIHAILASPVPVVTYVSPSGARAASAGTYILYASHMAAMAPGTNLGAATPVAIGGGLPLPGRDEGKDDKPEGEKRPANAMEAKAVNDAVAYIRSLAELRGRNVAWAEKAVREAASLSSREAHEQHVIDIVARHTDDLLAQLHGRTVAVGDAKLVLDTESLTLERVEPDWRTRFLAVITNPNVALILLMIGIYGLIFEFMSPGAVLPGTIGAICLLLSLYALAVLPVNYAGLGLMMLGIALMVAEAFTPTLGLGIGGVIAFVLGATILIDIDAPGFAISWPVIAGIAVTSLAFTLAVVRMALVARRRKVVSGREEMIGMHGQVQDWSGRSGHVFAHGERWKAISAAPLASGQRVRITGCDGITLQVEPDQTESS